jgi:nucleotide-binding universal stress UspA family protein
MQEIEDSVSGAETASARRVGVLVVGAGPTGLEVVRRTSKVTAVTLVDKAFSDSLWRLESDGVRLVEGDASSALVLRDAGAAEAYALLAATSEDEANIEACRLAVEFGVPEVICRITDPQNSARATAVGAQPVTSPVAMASALTARLPEGDQVLLVGEPDTLRAIADYFRLGAAQFPRQFGYSMVLWDEGGDKRICGEAEWLADVSRIESCYRLEEPRSTAGDTSQGDCADELKDRWRPLPLSAPPADPFEPVSDVHPALYIVAPPQTGLFNNRSLGTLGALLDRSSSPVLIARGSAPYRRILVPVTDSPTSWRGLELAVDIARLMDAKITALHVPQPRFLGGDTGDARTAAVVKSIEDIARLYGLHFEVQVQEGNSIRTTARVAEEHQLVVASRRRNQPDSYFAPDVGLRIALAAPCSAVLLSVS